MYGIYTDGTDFSTGGIDGVGNAYSANLLGQSRVLSDELFKFGPANQMNAVSCLGQPITLAHGAFTTLSLFGAAIEGNQLAQVLTVNYTDGTSTRFSQSFSDWYTPQVYPGEKEAVAMAYRDVSNGTKDMRTFNLYVYHLALDAGKVAESILLPNNSNIVLLSATLH